MINKMGMSVLNGWTISNHLYTDQNMSLYEAQKNDNGLILKAGIKIFSIPIKKNTDQEKIKSTIDKKLQSSMTLKGEHILNCEEYTIESSESSIDIIIRQEWAIPLSKYILQNNTFTMCGILNMYRSIADALVLAEKNKISHGSISPSSIYLCNDGTYKLADFEISSYLSELNVMQNLYLPTNTEDNNKDIFALGLIIYLLLNGNRISLQDSRIVTLKDFITYRDKGLLMAVPYYGTPKLQEIVYKSISSHKESRFNELESLLVELDSIDLNCEAESPIDLKLYEPPAAEPENIDITPIKKKNISPFLILVPVFMLIAILCSTIVILNLQPKTKSTSVPNFQGLTKDQAIEKASENKLIIKTIDSFSDEVENNYVIDQDIKKGANVDECSIITLQISKGSDKLKVPNLIGTPFNAVLASNQQFTYQYQVVYNDSSTGTIVDQDIPAGESVDYGAVINLKVSLGKSFKSVPNFKKMKQSKIKKICKKLGIKYVFIQESNDSIKKHYCISQSIAPYSVITSDTCVEIHISKGPEKTNKKN